MCRRPSRPTLLHSQTTVDEELVSPREEALQQAIRRLHESRASFDKLKVLVRKLQVSLATLVLLLTLAIYVRPQFQTMVMVGTYWGLGFATLVRTQDLVRLGPLVVGLAAVSGIVWYVWQPNPEITSLFASLLATILNVVYLMVFEHPVR